MIIPTYDLIYEAICSQFGSKAFFQSKNDVNLFGIRNKVLTPDKFDDLIGAAYRDSNNKPKIAYWDATTDPGGYYLLNPMNVNGTAIMVPGRYPKLWLIGGLHKGLWALTQNAPVDLYRDRTKDSIFNLDPKTIERTRTSGIDCHRADQRIKIKKVGKYSAGCQVIADPVDFEHLKAICLAQVKAGLGNTITYNLFNEELLLKI